MLANFLPVIIAVCGAAAAGPPPSFKKVMIVIFENKDYADAIAQPFMSKLGVEGAVLGKFSAETHPSQPNYIALTSGDLNGVDSDRNFDIDVRHIGDLLEAKGLAWKVYAEKYPGGCFLKARRGKYVRKHVPFLSYKDVQENPGRCARIVEAAELDKDIRDQTLPDYSLYIPDLNNDGHDTDAPFADKWLSKAFGPRLKDPRFMSDMLFIVTFDEDSKLVGDNHILTELVGSSVVPGAVSLERYDHYSLLRTIEDAFGLGTLGRKDAAAAPITGIWR